MPMTVLDAAYNVAHDYPGGATALAARMGKNPTSLNHELLRTGVAKLGLLDAVKMTDLSADDRILIAFAAARGQMLVPLPAAGVSLVPTCSMKEAGASAEKFSSLVSKVFMVKADSLVTDNEKREVVASAAELMVCITGLVRAITAECEASKPAFLREGQ